VDLGPNRDSLFIYTENLTTETTETRGPARAEPGVKIRDLETAFQEEMVKQKPNYLLESVASPGGDDRAG
jgi:hypothetical protein